MMLPLLLSALAHATPAAADAFQAGSCNLCHAVPEVAAASRQDSCQDCHQWIRAVAADPARREKAMAIFPLWPRYERNVASYLQVPSLEAAMARLEPAWVAGWLADPHDVRPAMPEGMPRFNLDESQRQAIAGAFAAAQAAPPASPAPDPANVAAGEALYAARGCPSCHTFGGRAALAPWPLAPDLARARDRMSPDMIAAWIQDPKAISPAATMPAMGLTAAEAAQVRDYLLLADPGAEPQPPLGPPPSPATAPVTWAVVEERVFGKICVHCHMDPAQNQGRTGPGNGGGFGWAATGIELQTYEGVAAAADRIPAALLRRRAEAQRDTVSPGHAPAALVRPDLPGMPLGLPPLPDEDLALVLGWIEQGMPR